MLNEGSVPASASAKNWSVLRTCSMYRAMPSGKTSAVNCRSFWTPSVRCRSDLPIRCSRRRAMRRV